MTETERSIYGDVEFGNIMPIVRVLETEICNMLSDPVLHPAKLRSTLEERNILIARHKRIQEEIMDWAEARSAARKAAR